MPLQAFLLIYVLGGLTFIPLLVLSLFAFAYLTLPRVSSQSRDRASGLATKATAEDESDSGNEDVLLDDANTSAGSGNDAAGYFAVCREYVPGGVNGKPPERSSPAGEVLSSESPSVYQSMYRSIFERNKTERPAVEGDKKDSKTVKRPRNVFFVVLRHRHLLLFDNADQLEVRHVVSLLHHDVDVYGGGERLLEGDLWIKKNCIRLTRRTIGTHPGTTSQPFYIFSDNCSEKEDFYHAILLAQSNAREVDAPPRPRQIDTDDIIKLVQALHKGDADPHCRWMNALLGRIFLAIYKTQDIEDAVKAKIDRKISRVPKPNFISSIQVQSVQMGDTAPVFSNPKLKELMVDGSMTIEMDVKYNGGFRLQIAAIARIELGSRIRAREVDLVLAGVLRKLSGHLLVRIKPPPSNRLWLSFETPPQMDFAVEPVVSSMQITYSVILRAIESRIKEVIGETLVLPNWDDMPFFDTEKQACRGGIWDVPRRESKDASINDTAASEIIPSEVTDSRSLKTEAPSGSDEDIDDLPPISSKTMSMPSLVPAPGSSLKSRKPKRKPVSIAETEGISTGTSADGAQSASTQRSKPSSPRFGPADKPKVMRSNSFASAATPVVSVEEISPSSPRSPQLKGKKQRDAVEMVKQVKSRSDSMPTIKPNVEQLEISALDDSGSDSSSKRNSRDMSSLDSGSTESTSQKAKSVISKALPISESAKKRSTWNLSGSPPTGSALERAATTAKNWGVSMINRQSGSSRKSVSGFTSLAKEAGLEESSASHEDMSRTSFQEGEKAEEDKVNPNKSPEKLPQPMGRGQPLPPAGIPLPGPRQSLWATSPLSLGTLRRKPVAGINGSGAPNLSSDNAGHDDKPTLPPRRRTSSPGNQVAGKDADATTTRKVSSTRKNVRRHSQLDALDAVTDQHQEVVVVAAPPEDDDDDAESVSAGNAQTLVPAHDENDDTANTAEREHVNISGSMAHEEIATSTEMEHAPTNHDRTDLVEGSSHNRERADDVEEEEAGTVDTAIEDTPPPDDHHREAVRISGKGGKGAWFTGPNVDAQNLPASGDSVKQSAEQGH
ncbi:hypothetical protein ANO11243_051650 [Dothideomycetidae sp. 11243]|nr:hypothetical protein ANO11243_051650 [fungal sp. No.11243]